MPEFENTFAPRVENKTITTSQVIQLLKIQIIKFTDLPQEVKDSVNETLSSSLKR